MLQRIAAESRFDSLAVMIFTECPDEQAYQLASERPNNDIQLKEELTLLPYRMHKFLSTYREGKAWAIDRVSEQEEKLGGEILFVDDSATVCAKYSELLRTNGYEVAVARSMEEALELARQHHFQLAVVDHYMPNGNGDELTRALLANPKTSHITVVMHSHSRDVLEQALDAGAIDLIWKDDPANIFLMRISSIIRSMRVKQQAEQLNVLLLATQKLGIGMVINQGGEMTSLNPTMDRFATECGGLESFRQVEDEHYRIEDHDGKWRTFSIHSIRSGEESVVLVQDVTEMADAVAAAEAASRAKDDFLASMSHELRTPLTTIIGNSEMLAESWLDPDQQQLLRSVEVSGKGLLSLINDILDRSKIEAGMFEVDDAPFSITTVLDNVEHIFSTRARESGLEFVVERGELPAHKPLGDCRRINQILINLLGNAIKFTQQGRVMLRFWGDNDRLHFAIRDSGIGISSEAMARLFQPFEQADSSISRRFGGTGLGLYISITLAQLMEGDIGVESVVGEGATFTLSLPYRPSEELESMVVSQRQTPLHQEHLQGRVLIAEDTPELQILERRMVEMAGCEVVIAENGAEAIAQARSSAFDLILMDMQMPEVDGIEATRTLRQGGNTTPIVALTANVMQHHRDLFHEVGCDGFLGKPIDRQELIGTLRKFLRREESGVTPSASERGAFDTDLVDDELLEIFRQATIDRRQQLQSAWDQGDRQQLFQVAHIIKGSGGLVGFHGLTAEGERLCDLLEKEGREEGLQQQELAMGVERLLQTVDEVLRQL